MTELQIFMNFDEEVSVTSKSYVCTLLLLYVVAKTIIGEFFTNETEIQKVINPKNLNLQKCIIFHGVF